MSHGPASQTVRTAMEIVGRIAARTELLAHRSGPAGAAKIAEAEALRLVLALARGESRLPMHDGCGGSSSD